MHLLCHPPVHTTAPLFLGNVCSTLHNTATHCNTLQHSVLLLRDTTLLLLDVLFGARETGQNRRKWRLHQCALLRENIFYRYVTSRRTFRTHFDRWHIWNTRNKTSHMCGFQNKSSHTRDDKHVKGIYTHMYIYVYLYVCIHMHMDVCWYMIRDDEHVKGDSDLLIIDYSITNKVISHTWMSHVTKGLWHDSHGKRLGIFDRWSPMIPSRT